MMVHLRIVVELSLGERERADRSTLFSRTVFRWFAFNVMPWPKGKIVVPDEFTPPPKESFDIERSNFLATVDRFLAEAEREPARKTLHPMFGPMTLRLLAEGPRQAFQSSPHAVWRLKQGARNFDARIVPFNDQRTATDEQFLNHLTLPGEAGKQLAAARKNADTAAIQSAVATHFRTRPAPRWPFYMHGTAWIEINGRGKALDKANNLLRHRFRHSWPPFQTEDLSTGTPQPNWDRALETLGASATRNCFLAELSTAFALTGADEIPRMRARSGAFVHGSFSIRARRGLPRGPRPLLRRRTE